MDSFEITNDRVIVKFKYGNTAKGGLLIGADGNNSVVRGGLKMENPRLASIPANSTGALRHFTPE